MFTNLKLFINQNELPIDRKIEKQMFHSKTKRKKKELRQSSPLFIFYLYRPK